MKNEGYEYDYSGEAVPIDAGSPGAPPRGGDVEIPPVNEVEQAEDFKIVRDLSNPIRRILEQIKSEATKGKYQLVIGDDASGRLPALILGGAMREIARKRGVREPEVRFVAGTRSYDPTSDKAKKEKIKAYIGGLKKTIPALRKVLVVTDIISTGASLEPLVHSIVEAGLLCDIATIDATPGKEARNRLGEKIIAGDGSTGVYSRRELAGVEKDRRDLHARRYVDLHEPHGTERIVASRRIHNVHVEAGRLAEELSEWFEKNTKAPGAKFAKIRRQASQWFQEE